MFQKIFIIVLILGSLSMCRSNFSLDVQMRNVYSFIVEERHIFNFTESSEGHGIVVYDNYIYICGDVNADIFVLKSTLDGSVVWNVTIGGSDNEECSKILAVDSYLYVVGYTESFGAGRADAFIVKINSSDGSIIWNVTWGGSDWDEAVDAYYYNGSLYVLGWTWSYDVGGGDFVILKIFENGTIDWFKTWGTGKVEHPAGIYIYNGNMYVVGYNESSSWGGEDIIFAVFDLNGNHIFNGSWIGKSWDEAVDICVNEYGIFILAEVYGYGAGSFDVAILKFSLTGEFIAMKTYGVEYDDIPEAMILFNGTMLIMGNMISDQTDQRNVFVIQMDHELNILASKVIPETRGLRYGDIYVYDNYVFVTSTLLRPIVGSDTILYKLDFDFDNDGLGNHKEIIYNCDPYDPDTDDDGLLDGTEVYQINTDPANNDTDSDGMPDGWEVEHGLNPLINDANEDADSDGLTNIDEYKLGTDPTNNDTDSDGYSDAEEVNAGTDPLDPSSHPYKIGPEIIIVVIVISVIAALLFLRRRNLR